MKRPLGIGILLALVAVVVVAVLQRGPEPIRPEVARLETAQSEAESPRLPPMRTPPPPALNSAGFVASDVARIAATGRPQLVELFHHG